MKSADKRTLCEAIIEAIEASDSSEGKGALFSQLDAIEPSTALRNQDLRPEDPEIEAARDNMSRIMNLPKGTFTRAGVELAHALKQATTISADFYNVITRADDSYAIYMVDVDHHGLPASLDAMRVQFALQAARGWGLGRPAAELEAADTLVRDVTGGQVSVSMNFLEVDVTGRRVRYASAGMPPALLFRRGESEPVRLLAVGSYVGEAYAFDFREPRQTDHPLGPGDIIVVCSDGITEARHPESGRTFGETRLTAAVNNHRAAPPDAIADAIVKASQAYSGRARPADDQSVVVVRMTDEPGQGGGPIAPARASLRVSESSDLRVRATIRMSRNWPSDAAVFVESSMRVADAYLKPRAVQRMRVALQEALFNALRHGCDEGDAVTVTVEQAPGRTLDAIIMQPRQWDGWESKLGTQRRRELREVVAAGSDRDPVLGGATLVAVCADRISCDGRRLVLQFEDRSEEDGNG